MAWGYGVPVPKPQTRLRDRIQYKKDRDQQERIFKLAVWMRDQGKCQHCGIKVVKSLTLTANRGEVHHLRPRSRAPEKRFDPDNGVLLCAVCH